MKHKMVVLPITTLLVILMATGFAFAACERNHDKVIGGAAVGGIVAGVAAGAGTTLTATATGAALTATCALAAPLCATGMLVGVGIGGLLGYFASDGGDCLDGASRDGRSRPYSDAARKPSR